MKRAVAKHEQSPETAESLTAQIEALNRQHERDMRKLHEWEAANYRQDMLDLYHSTEDHIDPETEMPLPADTDQPLEVSL
jgi:hypothetical protein